MVTFEFIRDTERNQEVAQFNAKLISMSSTPVGNFPSGKEYYAGTIEFTNHFGQKVQRGCIINAANHAKGMSEGNEYLCNAIIKDGQTTPLVVCSHLPASGSRATVDDFGFNVSTATRVVNANPLVVA
jgi:hypothetical protein